MPTIYEKADEDVIELIAEVMREHHPVLTCVGLRLDVLMAEVRDANGLLLPRPAIKAHGYEADAKIKATPLDQRTIGMGDALLVIDAQRWGLMSDEQQRALIDHELYHVQVEREGGGFLEIESDKRLNGTPKLDDIDRPKLKMRLHDWQLGGFLDIARRHGEHATEVRAARSVRRDDGQYVWDWAGHPVADAAGKIADSVLNHGGSVKLSSGDMSVTIDQNAARRIKANVERMQHAAAV